MKILSVVFSVLIFIAVTAYSEEEVHHTGPGTGVRPPAGTSADTGAAPRELNPAEMTEQQVHLIRTDGIALIVNEYNPLNKISKQQVTDIYTGKITSWKELGSYDVPIVIGTKAPGRSGSAKELFETYFNLKGKVKADARVIGSNTEVIAQVSAAPSAIGYVSVGVAESALEEGVPIKLLDLDGVKAESANVSNGTYPLRREVHLTTRGTPTKVQQKYMDYMLSPDGQEIVARKKFVPGR